MGATLDLTVEASYTLFFSRGVNHGLSTTSGVDVAVRRFPAPFFTDEPERNFLLGSKSCSFAQNFSLFLRTNINNVIRLHNCMPDERAGHPAAACRAEEVIFLNDIMTLQLVSKNFFPRDGVYVNPCCFFHFLLLRCILYC